MAPVADDEEPTPAAADEEVPPLAHSDRQSNVDAAIDLKADVERWFIASGVPHFVAPYSVRSRGPILDYVLLAILAWELAVAPWREETAVGFLLAPVIIAAIGIVCTLLTILLLLHPRSPLKVEPDLPRPGGSD